jgi:hypothetical protein
MSQDKLTPKQTKFSDLSKEAGKYGYEVINKEIGKIVFCGTYLDCIREKNKLNSVKRYEVR